MKSVDCIETTKPWIENGVVHVVFEEDAIISLQLAKELVRERIRISKNKSYPLYIDIRKILSVDADARSYLASDEGTKNAIAAAVHVDSPMSKFFANLFLSVNKPSKPMKLFTDKEKALRWLKKRK